jgi:hypothetical protein
LCGPSQDVPALSLRTLEEGDAEVTGEDHQFDRRNGDVNVSALAFRVQRLESRMEVVEERIGTTNLELAANTALTKQVHTAVAAITANTESIIDATKWLSTTKKIILGGCAIVAACGGAVAAGAAGGKALGLW